MDKQKALIEARHLNKVFGANPRAALELIEGGASNAQILERTRSVVAVRNASFKVYPGEVFVVMGLSGSGKSTMLRLLNRLIEPTAGQVYIGGANVTQMSHTELVQLRRARLTMVFQSFALMPHLRVWENAAFGLDVAGMPRRQQRERAAAALAQVGLESQASNRPDQLSGGMQQRVGLARALACGPEILLMDEAFSALDPLIRADMQDQLLELVKAQNLTVVFVSHDLDEAMRIGDRIAIVEDGRILQIGTPQDILEQPADPHVRHFFGGVDVANVYRAGDLARPEPAKIKHHQSGGFHYIAKSLQRLERHHAYVCDRSDHFLGVVSLDSMIAAMRRGGSEVEEAFLECEPLDENTDFQGVIHRLAHAQFSLPVVNAEQKFLGTVSRTVLLETLERDSST